MDISQPIQSRNPPNLIQSSKWLKRQIQNSVSQKICNSLPCISHFHIIFLIETQYCCPFSGFQEITIFADNFFTMGQNSCKTSLLPGTMFLCNGDFLRLCLLLLATSYQLVSQGLFQVVFVMLGRRKVGRRTQKQTKPTQSRISKEIMILFEFPLVLY